MITVQRWAFSMIAGPFEFLARRHGEGNHAVAFVLLHHDGAVVMDLEFHGDSAYGSAIDCGMTWLHEQWTRQEVRATP